MTIIERILSDVKNLEERIGETKDELEVVGGYSDGDWAAQLDGWSWSLRVISGDLCNLIGDLHILGDIGNTECNESGEKDDEHR